MTKANEADDVVQRVKVLQVGVDEVSNADEDDEDDDAVSRFLAKVDWRGVQADGTWVDVAGPPAAENEESGVRSQLDAANRRIAELEAKLRAAGLDAA